MAKYSYHDYEIIDTIHTQKINNRYTKLTWNQYFNKIYNTSIIICVSSIIYIYYYSSKKTKNTI